MFLAGTAPGEMERFFAHAPDDQHLHPVVSARPHLHRLNRLRDDIKTFVAERVKPDPWLNKVKVRYLGGEAGLYLGAPTMCSTGSTSSTSLSC